MPAPSYTEDEAAVHELGHAALAHALDLEFSHIELILRTNPNTWGGQCKLVQLPESAVRDAFQLGGPLVQMSMIPESLGKYRTIFQPSLFTNTRTLLEDNGAILDAVIWGSDLCGSKMLYTAPDAPYRQANEKLYGAKPWLLELEKEITSFATLRSVHSAVNELRCRLAESKRVEAAEVRAVFSTHVPCEPQAALRAFIERIL